MGHEKTSRDSAHGPTKAHVFRGMNFRSICGTGSLGHHLNIAPAEEKILKRQGISPAPMRLWRKLTVLANFLDGRLFDVASLRSVSLIV